MYELRDAAVPAMVRLYENMPKDASVELKLDLYDYLEENLQDYGEKTSFFSFDLPAYRAKNALSRVYHLK